MKNNTVCSTNFNFPHQQQVYKGKVRDVYTLNNDCMVMIASDRISAFDVVLPEGIPYKGQVLNQVATLFLQASKDICPNWLIGTPHPNVSVGYACQPIRVEMVIRGYLSGHAWREYKAGKRIICGVSMPEGMKENDRFPTPIITPASKAEEGHDEDISRDEIIEKGLVPKEIYFQMEAYTKALFQRGTEMAAQKGLILVDTKYEFGMHNGKIMLIDEIHTPDSSRYFYAEGYTERQQKGEKQKQLSKEFVREWLIANNFQGLEGQKVPAMSEKWVNEISDRYIELYEKITGKIFVRTNTDNLSQQIETATVQFLKEFQLV
jgi:phosphoribosylaminoimidazole-succinocarboxamide synthase